MFISYKVKDGFEVMLISKRKSNSVDQLPATACWSVTQRCTNILIYKLFLHSHTCNTYWYT